MTRETTLNVSAVILMLVVLVSVGVVYWAGAQRNLSLGPTVLAEDSLGRVWVIADNTLFTLSAEGVLLATLTSGSNGTDPELIELSRHRNGGVLVGSRATGRIQTLDAQGKLQQTIEPAVGPLLNGFTLNFNPDTGNIYVADVGYHRLLVLDALGKVVHQAGSADGAAGQFNFPNGIFRGPDKHWYVPDTNHHQIQILKDDLSKAADPIPVPSFDHTRWPANVSRLTDGRLIVVQLEDDMRAGAAAILTRDGKLDRLLDLQNEAQPRGLLVRAEDFLVSDQSPAGYQIVRFDRAGNKLDVFGDGRFNTALYKASKKYRGLEFQRSLGQLLALFAAALLLLVYLRSRNILLEKKASALRLPPVPSVSIPKQIEFFIALFSAPVMAAGLSYGFIRFSFEIEIPLFEGLLGKFAITTLVILSFRAAYKVAESERYRAVSRALAHRILTDRLKRLPDWNAEEPVLAFIRALFKRQLHIALLTPERLILVPLSGAMTKSYLLSSFARVEEKPAHWLFRLVFGSDAKKLLFYLPHSEQPTLALTSSFRSEQAEFLSQISERLKTPVKPVLARLNPAGSKQKLQRPLWSSLLLSALMPGLGHFNQHRNEEAINYLRNFCSLGLTTGLTAFVHYQRISQVNISILYYLLALTGAVWAWALFDIWRYETRNRETTPQQLRSSGPVR